MIQVDKLTEDDIGKWVEYWPGHEKGRIKTWKGSLNKCKDAPGLILVFGLKVK